MPPEPPSRRDFLRVSGAAALSVAAAQTPFQTLHAQSEPAPQAPSHQAPLPPHRSIQVPGIHAYPNQHSVEAGSPIQFHISSTEPYELAIFRLGLAVDDRSTDECLHVFETAPPLAQPIHPGSYVHVPNGLTGPCSALSLECWIRPWNLQRAQGLLTQHTAQQPSGFAIWLLPHGAIGFQLGLQDSPQPTLRETAPGLLSLHTWHHVIAIWNGQSQQIWVDGQLAGQWDHPGVFLPNTAPIRLGAAASADGVAQHFLDGDLATPALYAKALSPEDIQRQFALRGLFSKPPTETLGFWPLSEETGDHVADTSGHRRHGTIEPPPTPGLRREGSRGDEKGISYQLRPWPAARMILIRKRSSRSLTTSPTARSCLKKSRTCSSPAAATAPPAAPMPPRV